MIRVVDDHIGEVIRSKGDKDLVMIYGGSDNGWDLDLIPSSIRHRYHYLFLS